VRLALLIDADDTLWENNIYFERAFDDFVGFLDHSELTGPQIREVLNEIELVNAKIHGYGSKNFGLNLQQAYQRLAQRQIEPDDLNHVFSLAERILEQPVEIIEGVPETLAQLATRHDLTLFHKGSSGGSSVSKSIGRAWGATLAIRRSLRRRTPRRTHGSRRSGRWTAI
jgi:putative hydrolase of the HAD superfamily